MILSWIWKLFSPEKILYVILAASVACALWFYASTQRAEASIANLRADNSKLTEAVAEKDSALNRLQYDISVKEAMLAQRDRRIDELNSYTIQAITSIQRAKNDGSACDIDALLPNSLSDPLRILYTATAGSNGPSDNINVSSGKPVSAEGNAQNSGTVDGQKPGAMVR